MSAHAKRADIPVTNLATSNEEWSAHMKKPGLRVVDAYAKWAGPCEPMTSIFKRFKLDFGDQVAFVQAQTDAIDGLVPFRNKSCPTFLFYWSGVLVNIVRGANSPLIEKTIKEQLELEKNGHPHTPMTVDGTPVDGSAAEATAVTTSQDVLAKTPSTQKLSASNPVLQAVPAPAETVTSPDGSEPFSPAVKHEQTVAIIKPDAMSPTILSEIISTLKVHRFDIVSKKKVWLSTEIVEQYFAKDGAHVSHWTASPVLALLLSKENGVSSLKELIGSESPSEAKQSDPKSIRARFGTDNRSNAIYGSDSVDTALKEIEVLFGDASTLISLPLREDIFESILPAQPLQKSLVIVKPDAVTQVENILSRILSRGFQVLKREERQLSVEQATEFYSTLSRDADSNSFVESLIAHLSSGPSIAFVVQGEDAVDALRIMGGLPDPEQAKSAAPNSLRALFGSDKVKNALHVSETVEDSLREIQLLFPSILKGGSTPNLMGSRQNSKAQLVKSGSKASLAGSKSNLVAAAPVPVAVTTTDSSHGTNAGLVERTLALIKPDAYQAGKKDEIISRIKESGFTIVKEQELHLSAVQAQEFYKEHNGKPFYEELVSWMSSTQIYAIVLERENAIAGWRELAGPTNSVKAREVASNSIRALYGTDGSKNAVHGSDSPSSAEREIGLLFPEVHPRPDGASPGLQNAPGLMNPTNNEKPDESVAVSVQQTLALIKPDAYGSGKKEDIVSRIKSAGFTIVQEAEIKLSLEKAKLFYKEHDGKPFYETLTTWMSSAPIYALVLEKQDGIKAWRDLAGPTNSEKAREISPESIRALYGKDGSENAVHGSDSPASAEREIKIMFGLEETVTTPAETSVMSPLPDKVISGSKDALSKSKENLNSAQPAVDNNATSATTAAL